MARGAPVGVDLDFSLLYPASAFPLLAPALAMSRFLRSLLFVGAAALSVAACESTEDPFVGSDTGVRDTSGRDTVSTDTVSTDTAVDVPSVDVGTDTGTPDTGETDTGTPDTGETDTGTPDTGDFTCGEGVVFTGQVFADDDPEPLSPNGGAPRFEPWDETYDAGIAALVEAAPDAGGDPVDGEWTITDATVIATEYNNDSTQRAQRSFWLADGNGKIAVFFGVDATENHPTFSIKVGQRISGTVTQLGNYNSMRQISGATGSAWALSSEDNEVYINDVTTGAVVADDINSVVRVTGTLTSLDNEDCGGSKCYTMTYNGGETIPFRTSSQFVELNQCVTYVGPVRGFNGQPQLDTLNFDWLWTYDN